MSSVPAIAARRERLRRSPIRDGPPASPSDSSSASSPVSSIRPGSTPSSWRSGRPIRSSLRQMTSTLGSTARARARRAGFRSGPIPCPTRAVRLPSAIAASSVDSTVPARPTKVSLRLAWPPITTTSAPCSAARKRSSGSREVAAQPHLRVQEALETSTATSAAASASRPPARSPSAFGPFVRSCPNSACSASQASRPSSGTGSTPGQYERQRRSARASGRRSARRAGSAKAEDRRLEHGHVSGVEAVERAGIQENAHQFGRTADRTITE